MTPRQAVCFASFATALCFAAGGAQAQLGAAGESDLDRFLASEQAVVVTPAGRVFRGHLDGWRDGRLHLRFATDGGEVVYSFAAPEIARLDLPGGELETAALEQDERGEVAEALPLLAALSRQRVRYLPVLSPSQRWVVFAFVRASAAAGDPFAAIGHARQLEAYATSDEERILLADANLRAHLRLGLRDEARRLAREWCAAADPAGPSALGWAVLARLAWEEGDAEGTLWTALQPVALGSQRPAHHLDECYAWSVCAAHQLGLTDKAAGLFREMQARGLPWPDEPGGLARIGAIYRSGPESMAGPSRQPPEPARAAARASPGAVAAPTLDDVCRLVHPRAP